MTMRTWSLVPSRRQFLSSVLPAGTLFCLGLRDSGSLKTTEGQPVIEDERVKALWTKGFQMMQKGYT